jgi:fructose-1-phosphate kinase PfkB-like protein
LGFIYLIDIAVHRGRTILILSYSYRNFVGYGFGQVARVEAIHEAKAIDTTGAGDLYAAGFIYGMINGFSLEDCCKAGCCTGAGVVQGLGGEVAASVWDWVYEKLERLRRPVKDEIRQSVKSRHIDTEDQTAKSRPIEI